jgi:Undecaprenyl-phosphate galactose phosphotransferase WbaP
LAELLSNDRRRDAPSTTSRPDGFPAGWTKRGFDLTVAILGGILCLPFFAIIAILVRLSSPGPAFYGHVRIGQGGKRFRTWKFRTMVVDADKALHGLLASNPQLCAEWRNNHKLQDDPRVTRFGALLRKTSIDEAPQLWNVIRGEMSLVGPRPIVDAEIAKYSDFYRLYQTVRPGITGLWQISGRSDTSYAERVELDAHYVGNWSLWLDMRILASTLKTVVSRAGAV